MIKRGFDIFASAVALLILWPVFLLLGLWVKMDSEGPVFFCQNRAGKDDREFCMIKFRTMKVGTPELATDLLTNPEGYITKSGRWMRKYSLDELPQLWNVLAGDMSIVGPRPALHNQDELRQLRNEKGISTIRPGLTGWAQVNGRDELSLEEKVQYDAYYLHHQTFWFDIRIIWYTIFSISKGG